MLFEHLREDEDVIQIDDDDPFSDKVFEDVVHHGLESCRAIGETEEHDEQFEQSAVGLKSGFPLITFLHPDIVKTPPDVQFREVLGTSELCDQLQNEGQQVFVLHGHGIEHPVILY